MRKLLRNSLLAAFYTISLLLTAAEPSNSAGTTTAATEWVTAVYQIRPGSPWWDWQREAGESYIFSAMDSGKDPLPAPDASKEAWIKHIQRATAGARKEFGIVQQFPRGTAFLYDEITGTLAVRIPKTHLPDVQLLIDGINDRAPRTMSFQLYLLEGPAAEISQIATDCLTQDDHSPSLARALKGVDEGRWKMLAQPTGEVRATFPGQTAPSDERLVIEVGPQWHSSYAGEISSSGEVIFQTSPQPPELLFEADPVLRLNNFIDLYYTLEYHFAPPRHWFAKARHLPIPQASAIQLPMVATHSLQVTTAAPFRASQPRLLSVWTPTAQNGVPRKGIMQIAFLLPQVRPVFPPINEQLKDIFLTHVEAAEPITTSKAAPSPMIIPPGMAVRHIKVPSDFLSGSPSPDPTSTERSNAEVEKILRASGISLPEGSRIHYSPYSGQLTLTNTPANLDAVEAYSSSLGDAFPMKELIFTADIIQADASLLRPILAKSTASGDHDQGRRDIETLLSNGQAQIIDRLNLSTRNGMRGAIESGQTIMMPAHVEVKLPPTPEASAKEGQQPDAKIAPPVSAHANSEIGYDTRLAGTRLEIDPILSQDYHSVDLGLKFEYHYAPPEIATSDDPLSAREPIKFHRYSVSTTTMVPLKTSRILGVWKPDGSPEFEGKDLLQVAFFRVDLRLVNPP